MTKMIVLDEIHVTILVPANMPKSSLILRTLKSKTLQGRLRAAITSIFRRQAALKDVKVVLSR